MNLVSLSQNETEVSCQPKSSTKNKTILGFTLSLEFFVLNSQNKDQITVLVSIKKTPNGFTPVQKYYIKPSKKSDKKIYLLTSPFSSSSTEIFVLGSLSFNNFKRLGSKTNGIFSELLWKQLPNGWEYSLSNEVYMDTKNKTYEGEGIEVDINFEYPQNKNLFYNSFFTSNKFSDKLINQIIEN